MHNNEVSYMIIGAKASILKYPGVITPFIFLNHTYDMNSIRR